MSMRLARPEWALEIERLRGRLNLSQAALAKILNVSAMAPSRWERGINEPTGEIYIQMGRLAGPPQCWTFWRRAGLEKQDIAKVLSQSAIDTGNEDQDAGLALLPIVKLSWSGELGRDGVPQQQVAEQIAVPRHWCPHPEQTVCIHVEDDFMAPDFRKGYVVAVDLAVNKSRDLVQQFVAVRWQESLLIRSLQATPEGLVLAANDSTVPPVSLNRPAVLLGKAMWWVGQPQEKSPARLRKAVSGSAGPFSSR